jgi:peptide/nickel transport system ATP-binding protein
MAASSGNVLSVRNLCTEFRGQRGNVRVLEDISFEVGRGRIVGLVGESGSGKSVTALSLMGLVPTPTGSFSAELIDLDGTDLAKLGSDGLRRIRGRDLTMVFQEPMTSLNPVRRVWEQVGEPLRVHRRLGRREIRERVLHMFEMVGIPEPKARLDAFPHELSGGLRQRAMIAMGLICEPKASDRRRAHDRTGRDHAGPDPAADSRSARPGRHLDHHDHPRPRDHCRDV